jgi:hypothetical protein
MVARRALRRAMTCGRANPMADAPDGLDDGGLIADVASQAADRDVDDVAAALPLVPTSRSKRCVRSSSSSSVSASRRGWPLRSSNWSRPRPASARCARNERRAEPGGAGLLLCARERRLNSRPPDARSGRTAGGFVTPGSTAASAGDSERAPMRCRDSPDRPSKRPTRELGDARLIRARESAPLCAARPPHLPEVKSRDVV